MDAVCTFAKALLAQSASCGGAAVHAVGEQLRVQCRDVVAQARCAEVSRGLHDRARFALRLPPDSRPITHRQALRLECGGLAALRQWLQLPADVDVRQLLERAAGHGDEADWPWQALVPALAAWQPPPRRGEPR